MYLVEAVLRVTAFNAASITQHSSLLVGNKMGREILPANKESHDMKLLARPQRHFIWYADLTRLVGSWAGHVLTISAHIDPPAGLTSPLNLRAPSVLPRSLFLPFFLFFSSPLRT
jgi:hypothetical protein